jgi:hypothetical protein
MLAPIHRAMEHRGCWESAHELESQVRAALRNPLMIVPPEDAGGLPRGTGLTIRSSASVHGRKISWRWTIPSARRLAQTRLYGRPVSLATSLSDSFPRNANGVNPRLANGEAQSSRPKSPDAQAGGNQEGASLQRRRHCYIISKHFKSLGLLPPNLEWARLSAPNS